ncbi:pyridoxamine 5'-phosphate oxidase [Planomonospora sphaerica]|uniref:Pyridoxamine 5'-phosphate oxidase n=1 Tax=Planomonospora sphaerica TaxID=161355 RepID=A0A171CS51_9ACTN|nr:pyridoxamine 5'-phosphate oxidase family protein [Planomonospora sphaerica]GAT67130.1 pyridoxamine 5'-phosphate oxidase [Planomonospora sphaerica]
MREPVAERNLDGYGAPPISWARVLERLEKGFPQVPGSGGPGRHTCWLTTVRPDGRPHVMPLGVLWLDGALYFNTGPGTRKGRNLAHDPHCVITFATQEFDLVVEGRAERVTGERLHRVAEGYAAQGWRPSVRDDALHAEHSAPSAGPPPWYVYEVAPVKVFALGTAAPYGATGWRF